MTLDPTSPDEADAEDPAGLPSVDEVVARLDRLWDDLPDPAAQRAYTLTGRSIGPYDLLDKIGYGAFGVVYRAFDPRTDRHVAIKIPRPEVVVDREKLRRFESEAKVLESLEHPQVVPLLAAELNGPTPFIAMEFVSGPDLAQCLSDLPGLVSWQEAARFMALLAGAVQYAHENGVIHRDIKPSNVLLKPKEELAEDARRIQDFHPQLTDFGLAKLESGLEDTRSSLMIGTPLYMAPELLSGKASDPVKPTADVYSLGCLLYELLTGQPPILGDSYVEVLDRLRSERPVSLRRFRPDVPKDLEAICRKCLEKNPQARYATAESLANDLTKVADGQSIKVGQPKLRTQFRYWLSLPQRVRDAGWYSFVLNSAAVIWLSILTIVFHHFMNMNQADYLTTLKDGIIAIANHMLMAFFALNVLRGKRWAIWAGLFDSAWIISLMVLFYLDLFPIFAALYREDPYHKLANIMVILTTAISQLVLYSFAIISIRSPKSPV